MKLRFLNRKRLGGNPKSAVSSSRLIRRVTGLAFRRDALISFPRDPVLTADAVASQGARCFQFRFLTFQNLAWNLETLKKKSFWPNRLKCVKDCGNVLGRLGVLKRQKEKKAENKSLWWWKNDAG